jgi:hypothetical protein
VAGDDAWDKLAPDLRERMRASSETAFGVGLGSYERYLPDDATLAAVAPSVRLLVSADGLALLARRPADSGSGSVRMSRPRRVRTWLITTIRLSSRGLSGAC